MMTSHHAPLASAPAPVAGSRAAGVTNRTLAAGRPANLTFVRGIARRRATVMDEGAISDINAVLSGLIYRHGGNYHGFDSLGITTDDRRANDRIDAGIENASMTINSQEPAAGRVLADETTIMDEAR